jgi:DNA-binding MarR family transcriptional regulator
MSQDLGRDFFLLLHDVARLIRVEADKRAKRHGMTRAQWALLIRLEQNPGLSQKEVADLLEVEPISVARLVDRLEAGGLIERRPDPADRRIWRLHLLPAAAAALDEIAVQRAELAELIGGNVAKPVREAMLNGLLQMKANLLRAPEPAPDQKLREIA